MAPMPLNNYLRATVSLTPEIKFVNHLIKK